MRDPLIGRWFVAVKEHDDGCRTAYLRGQIVGKPGAGVLVCSLDYGSQTLVSLGDMPRWPSYTSGKICGGRLGVGRGRTEAHRDHQRDGARGE